jgi:secondary thiamine-phosphate synthase enzyme
METFQATRTMQTTTQVDFVDITNDVQEALGRSAIRNGHVTVFTTTPKCALIVNEYETGLLADLRRTFARMESRGEPTGRTLLGASSVVLPAVAGRLRLGMWQRVLLVEHDGPEERGVVVQIVGE